MSPPIYSYGIILLNKRNQVLLVQRRHTIEFLELIRGRFSNREMAYEFLFHLTKYEMEMVQTKSFYELWPFVSNFSEMNSFQAAKDRFQHLKVREMAENIEPDKLQDEPDFVLPKGRKQRMETDKQAAIREFEEETGISRNTIFVTNRSETEFFYGSNGKLYATKYFVAYYDHDNSVFQSSCPREVQSVQFMSLQEALVSVQRDRSTLRHILFKILFYRKVKAKNIF